MIIRLSRSVQLRRVFVNGKEVNGNEIVNKIVECNEHCTQSAKIAGHLTAYTEARKYACTEARTYMRGVLHRLEKDK